MFQKYYLNTETGSLFHENNKHDGKAAAKDKGERADSSLKKDKNISEICLVSYEEFRNLDGNFPHKKYLCKSMEHIRYCKIESFSTCIQGTMRVPWSNGENIIIRQFGFYINHDVMYLIDEQKFLNSILQKLKSNTYGKCTLSMILLVILESVLEDDVIYLQEQEQQLLDIEEGLLRDVPDDFYKEIIVYRKKLTLYHSYYEQLMNVGDHMQEDLGQKLTLEERSSWQLYSERAERLHDHVETLREYIIQIMGLYQSQMDSRQNKIMSMLTVVTTIFLPLTLIAGWYGMNFPRMPEFHLRYAYPIVIGISALTIVLEIIYFKKKKML